MSDLLIAGAVALDDLAWNGEPAVDQLGGGGFHAAVAAAPFARVQLWARAGRNLTHPMQRVLEQRGIDLAGVSFDGATPRLRAGVFVPGGPLLPEVSPGDPGKLGAALIANLPADEGRRAVAEIRGLPGGAERTLVVQLGRRQEQAWAKAACSAATVAILPVDAALAWTGTADPLEAGETIRSWGPLCVLLTAGPLGGLIVYQKLATTWTALPTPCADATGVSAAFAGAFAGWLATGKIGFTDVKRAAETASAVATFTAAGLGARKLLDADRAACLERFNRLRRAAKS